MKIEQIFKTIDEGKELSFNQLLSLIKIDNRDQLDKLFEKAYKIKSKYVGETVYYRGIIEYSNICIKNCYYCGIRKDNKNVKRFIMDQEDILKSAKWCYEQGFGSLVIQSGERQDEKFISFIEETLLKIKELSNNTLGITLSLGEQTQETYRRWFKAGAHRYLLRVESSNRELYEKIHPKDHIFDQRIACLKYLKDEGYQVGTGVMIGLPFQTMEDLINDILFFKKMDIDMIGMGPYIVHKETPLAESFPNFDQHIEDQIILGLKMIALTRIYLKDVNIAASTALQALDPVGRERGLKAGANIIMPNISETDYRKDYQLYDGKPCIEETSGMCKHCLEGRILSVGEKVGYKEWGDSPHFKKRVKK